MDARRLGLISTRLHYFQVVAQTGSIRRAAHLLNVAPSAISRSIIQLEQDLGAPLFERIRQRLRLTSAGEILVYHARITQSELTKASALIDDLKGLRRGSIVIAAAESVARGLFPQLMSGFWERFPNVTVDVRVMGSRQAMEAVGDGECDLALAFDFRGLKKTVTQLASASVGIGALVRPDHPLARRNNVRLRDFAGERVLLSDASLTLGESIEEAMRGLLVASPPRARTNSISVMTALAVHGCGVAFQTRVGVETELARGDLVFLPLRDPQLRPRKLILAARSRGHLPRASAALAEMLTKALDRQD
jgi:DNA-binding transcriptional LysR family regulator